jgi:malic enzyme
MSISLNLKSGYDADNAEVIECLSALKQTTPNIQVQFISREEAFEVLKKRDPELSRVIE